MKKIFVLSIALCLSIITFTFIDLNRSKVNATIMPDGVSHKSISIDEGGYIDIDQFGNVIIYSEKDLTYQLYIFDTNNIVRYNYYNSYGNYTGGDSFDCKGGFLKCHTKEYCKFTPTYNNSSNKDLNGDTITVNFGNYVLSRTFGEDLMITNDKIIGDINGDGLINAKDATVILKYSAYKGTGGDKSLEEFLIAED